MEEVFEINSCRHDSKSYPRLRSLLIFYDLKRRLTKTTGKSLQETYNTFFLICYDVFLLFRRFLYSLVMLHFFETFDSFSKVCIVFNVHGIAMVFRRIIESFRQFQNFFDLGIFKVFKDIPLYLCNFSNK